VKVLGVHPSEGHDIPGVRSRRALKLTDFFLPAEYDGVLEIGNDAAYQMCKRLNQEESLIAGPSSGMALAGAFELVPDEPGALCVVMFPDNVFKYISSLRKHLPEMFPDQAVAPNPVDSPTAPDEVAPAEAARMIREGAELIDVRTPEEFMAGHLPEAVNLPLQALQAGPVAGLPPDKSKPIVTICATGRRSLVAVDLLRKQGYTQVSSSRGGMRDWMTEIPTRR
jgi:rhodanese-related sulfurtransferase